MNYGTQLSHELKDQDVYLMGLVLGLSDSVADRIR